MSSRFTYLVIGPILAVSFLLLIVGAAAAWYAHSLNKSVSDAIAQNLSAVLSSERLLLELRDIRLDVNRLIETEDRVHLQAALGSRREVNRSLQDLQRSATTDDVHNLLQQVKVGSEELFSMLASLDGGKVADLRDVQDLFNSTILPPAEELLRLNRDSASSASRRNRVIADRMGLGLLLLGVCGSVAGLLGGFGIARWVSRSIVQLSLPIHDTAGKLDEVVGPVMITAGAGLRELEAAMKTISDKTSSVIDRLQKSQQDGLRLEQMAAIGQMAAGLAHEIRNPLMSMKILVQTADEADRPNGLTSRDLQVLQEEINRLEHLTQVFLDYSRNRKPEKQTFDLAEIIQRVVCVVSNRAERQSIDIQFNPPASTLRIEADKAQVHQLLLNLVLNSLDALPQHGTIRITADRRHNHDGVEQAFIRVADNGPGLPRQLGSRIFDPFVSGKETGVGLGLSISKQIAEAHGGSIEAADQPDGGAVFTVCLPGCVGSASPAEGSPSEFVTDSVNPESPGDPTNPILGR